MKGDNIVKRPAACLLSLAPTAPGLFVSFAPSSHNTLTFVDLTMIAGDGKFLR